MTDYYPLISRAVASLSKNTGEARRTIYERARSALVDQLRGLDPPLPESEITRQRLALEESIRKVESEAARRPRTDPRRASLITPGRPPTDVAVKQDESTRELAEDREATRRRPAPRFGPAGVGAEDNRGSAESASARRLGDTNKAPQHDDAAADTGKSRRSGVGLGSAGRKSDRVAPPPVPAARPQSEGNPPRSLRSPRAPSDRAPLADTGLKGFRDEMVEAETLGEATALAAKSARRAYLAPPSEAEDHDRSDAPAMRSMLRESSNRLGRGAGRNSFAGDAQEAFGETVEPDQAPEPEEIAVPAARRRRSTWRGLVAAALAVIVVLGLGAAGYWQRDRLKSLMVRSSAPPIQQQETPKVQTKIPDRVTQGTSTTAPTASPDQSGAAAVAQRVVLYEEDPGDPQGKRYVGSVTWRTEAAPPSPGQPPEMAVRANLEIPERRMNMTMSVHRNTDKALPASHTIELVFNLPPDFPYGGISNVPGVLMKQAEQTRGAPLAGLAVKVTAGFFLLGLSSAESDMQRNLQLLKERSWFDIPIVYGNGRRAILAVEKGTPGERAFNEAFTAWGE